MNARVLLLVLLCGCAGGGVVLPLATFGTATGSAHSTFCGAVDASDSTVYDSMQVTQRPVLYEAEDPHYPRRARAHGAQGHVLLAVTIDAHGRAEAHSIQTISSPDSALTDAAVEWIRGAKFIPVCRAGKAVRVRAAIPVDFKP